MKPIDENIKKNISSNSGRNILKKKSNLYFRFIDLFHKMKIDSDFFKEVEEKLLISDIGVRTTKKIISNLEKKMSCKQLKDVNSLYELLRNEMIDILAKIEKPLDITFSNDIPFVILVVGVNGVGKTTTIGKLAYRFKQQGKSVILAAGDTFRAAAVEQLQFWGQKSNVPVISQRTGYSDPSSVIFDAIKDAKKNNINVLIVDTAGRLQNKLHLMKELKKIARIMKKINEDMPHETMLVVDATTGMNAINQAKLFHETVGLTGIVLTKLDNTAKGGMIFSISDQLGIPVRYISSGENVEDLHLFNSNDFIEAILPKRRNFN